MGKLASPAVTRLAAAVLIAAVVAILALQVPCRPVDRDEGFWLYTGWRVSEGAFPYRDFALPHLPAALYLYAGVVRAFGPSLYAARGVNVLLIMLGGVALGAAAARRWNAGAGALTFLFYWSSSLTLTWFVPLKALGPATFALALAVAAVLWPSGPARLPLRAALAGAALGLAAMARLTLVATIPAAAAGIWLLAPPRRRLGAVAALCAAFAVVVASAAYFRAAAGNAFVFNVWGIHTLFVEQTGGGRWLALRDLFLPPDPVILVVLAAAALGAPGGRRELVFPLGAAGFILLGNLAPGTTSLQYFAPLVAALAVPAATAAARLRARAPAWGTALVLCVVALGAARPAAKIIGDRAHKPLVGPAEAYGAAEVLRRNTPPGEVVFTAWPGYAALARRGVMPGWELGYFTDRIGSRVPAESRQKYHLMTYDETAAALARGRCRFVLDGLDTPAALRPTLRRYFVPHATGHGVTLWRYAGPPPALPKAKPGENGP